MVVVMMMMMMMKWKGRATVGCMLSSVVDLLCLNSALTFGGPLA
jgi:hypothetical protein